VANYSQPGVLAGADWLAQNLNRELKGTYASDGVVGGKPIISYSRNGERSSHTWFLLKYLPGYKDVVNYDGSWTEWGIWLGRRSNVARRRRQRPEYSVAPV
jgi:hypothetical protein